MKKSSIFEEQDENITIDPTIKELPNPSPRKMAIATAIVEKYVSSQKKKHTKKSEQPPLSPLQKELLNFYTLDPTEKQMQQLKDFLFQLFINEIYKPSEK